METGREGGLGRRSLVRALAAVVLFASVLTLTVASTPMPASATPAFVQKADAIDDSYDSTITATFSSSTTVGDVIVAGYAFWDTNGVSTSCSDDAGNTYHVAVTEDDTAEGEASAVCYAPVTTAGASTVTVNFPPGTAYRGIIISEFSGLDTSNLVDTTASSSGDDTGGTDGITSTAASTTANGDLIYGFFESDGGGAPSMTAGTGFTLDDSISDADNEQSAEYGVQSTAGSIAATETWGTNWSYSAGMIAFRPANYSVQSSSTTSVTITPSFTFSIANQGSACNGESNFVGGAGTASTVALGNLAAGANVSGGQALTVAGNSGGGFAVYVAGTQASQNLRSASHNWTDVTGTYASPAVLGAGERFGYTYHDATASSSVTNPASAKFVALTNAGTNEVMGSTSSSTGTGCVSFDAQTSASTPAASYTATVIYTAIPTF